MVLKNLSEFFLNKLRQIKLFHLKSEICNRHKNLAVGIKITIVWINFRLSRSIKITPVFCSIESISNWLHFDYVVVLHGS